MKTLILLWDQIEGISYLVISNTNYNKTTLKLDESDHTQNYVRETMKLES